MKRLALSQSRQGGLLMTDKELIERLRAGEGDAPLLINIAADRLEKMLAVVEAARAMTWHPKQVRDTKTQRLGRALSALVLEEQTHE